MKRNPADSAARLLLACVLGLFALKIAVGVLTGSISIWAQAVDSSLDIFAVIITFLTVGYSTKPADRGHPFGHGKAEDIAAGIQAILLFAAAVSIVYSSVNRIIGGEKISLTGAGIAVMLVSVITNIWLSRYLFKVAKETDSTVLEGNAANIRGDVYSTSGVLIGLSVVQIGQVLHVNLTIIDPIIAIIVSALILKAAYSVGLMAWNGLLDISLPEEEKGQIMDSISEHGSRIAGFHELRTRKSGRQRFIDLHLVVPGNISVEEAHNTCDLIEHSIESKLPNTTVTIHVEPEEHIKGKKLPRL